MSLKYQVVPVTSFAQNCSIVWCDETMEGIVVDPGGDIQQLAAIIEELGVKVVRQQQQYHQRKSGTDGVKINFETYSKKTQLDRTKNARYIMGIAASTHKKRAKR